MNEVVWLRWDIAGLNRGDILVCYCRAGDAGYGWPGDQVCTHCGCCGDCCPCVAALSFDESIAEPASFGAGGAVADSSAGAQAVWLGLDRSDQLH